jgi:hypothetical protein
MVAIAVAVTTVGAAQAAAAAPPPAETIAPRPMSLTGFDAGNIIEDPVFFAKNTMTAAEIQSFLNAKVPTCQSGYTCLKAYGQATTSRAADAMCRSAYVGRSWESAASIIYNVAQACGINPQVLLVMLQKEQGLVLHTWPSSWRYTAAMGQGCPDTAACDAKYYGFFNQVYGAAWQMKRYANPPGTSAYFTWYAPGRTWNVQYNPNRSCGSGPVGIRNQATANLYYYTPYQPNAAALRAGYGSGDGCSSYGNRNFYNYFTDWFGSTRATGVTIVKTEADPAVYLVSGTTRWHIADGTDYAELNAAFGPTYIVGSAFVAGFANGGTTGAVIRDTSSGTIALVQGGKTHRFASCTQVTAWGGSCTTPVNVTASTFSKAPAGAEVGPYFRVRGTSTWGRFDGATSVTPLYDEAAVKAAAGVPRGTTPYTPLLSAARYATFTKAPLQFAPAQLVRSSSSSTVYLTVDFDKLLSIGSWNDVVEFGRTSSGLAVVADKDLARYKPAGAVAQTLRCDGTTYYPAQGTLYALTKPDRQKLSVMDASSATCAQFPVSSAKVGTTLAVKRSDSASVYVIEAGVARSALAWNALVLYNGGTAPAILTIRAATLATYPAGRPIADGLVVKTTTSADLSLVNGFTLNRIPSMAVAGELGLSTQYTTLTATTAKEFTKAGQLSLWVTCGSATYFAAGGVLVATTREAAQGFTPVALSAASCATLRLDAKQPVAKVFVKSAASTDVYAAGAGGYRKVASWQELVKLAGTPSPRILTVSSSAFASEIAGSIVR